MSTSCLILICVLWFFHVDATSVTTITCDVNKMIVIKNLNGAIKQTCPRGTTGVSIKGGEINIISNNFVNGLEKLQSFKMENVNLEGIESETFENLTELGTLQLIKTNLSIIKKRAFTNLPNLYVLDLSGNKLSEIKKGVFENVTATNVDLSDNKISKIEVEAFSGLFAYSKFSRLRFNLQTNRVESLNPEVFNHPLLSHLFLDNNQISLLHSGDLSNLPNLEYLSLSKNQITEIPEGVFNGSSLENLDLKQNKIGVIATRAFDNMNNLQKIFLDYNKLTTWSSDWFHGSNRITQLSVTYNFIEKLPDEAFKNLVGCSFLTFESNGIRTISNNAFKGANLTVLVLSFNRLEELNLTRVEKVIDFLDLSGNSISCSEDDSFRAIARTVLVDEC